MDDKLIMDGLKQKERKAYNMLFEMLYPQLRFFTEQITKNEAEAEDISINSLVKFWQKGPDHFETFLQVRKWIFTIARNAAYDYLKKEKIQQAYIKSVMQTSHEEEKREDQSVYKLEAMMKALEDNLDRLPGQCREAFRLVFIENMPRPEVAKRLNISPGTVNVHCADGMKKLRKIFSEKDLIVLFLLGIYNN